MDFAFETLTQAAEQSAEHGTKHGTCSTLTWDTSLPNKLSQSIVGGYKKIVISLRDQEQGCWIKVLIDGTGKSGSANCYVYNSFGLSRPSSAFFKESITKFVNTNLG